MPDALARMKPGAVLINTARGSMVDEHALNDALARGHLSGAVLDTFDIEPLPVESPLLRLDTVTVTPAHRGRFHDHGKKWRPTWSQGKYSGCSRRSRRSTRWPDTNHRPIRSMK